VNGEPLRSTGIPGLQSGEDVKWQIVPSRWRDVHLRPERTLKTWLYLMSLPDYNVYLAPGGTFTVAPDGRSGTLDTTVTVADGRPVAVSGPWSCGNAQG
jgi:hypothetical protein